MGIDIEEGGWMIPWTGVVVHCRKWCGWQQTEKSGKGSSLASTAHKGHELRRRRLRDRWADIDETWHLYCVDPGAKFLGSGILNFGPCVTRVRRPTPKGCLSMSLHGFSISNCKTMHAFFTAFTAATRANIVHPCRTVWADAFRNFLLAIVTCWDRQFCTPVWYLLYSR